MLPLVDSIFNSSLNDCSHTYACSLAHVCSCTHTLTDRVFTVASRSCSPHFRSTMWRIVAGTARCWLSSEVLTEMREIERMSQMPFSVPLHPLHVSVYFSKEEGVGMASSLTGTICRFPNGLGCSHSLKWASVCSVYQVSSHFRKKNHSPFKDPTLAHRRAGQDIDSLVSQVKL